MGAGTKTRKKINAGPGPDTVTAIRVWVREFLDGVPQDPIPDAKVTLTEFANGVTQKPRLTDINGNVSFGFLPAGKYWVQVDKPLYGPIPATGNKPTAGPYVSAPIQCDPIAKLPKDPAKPGNALPALFDVRMVIELETPNFMMEFGDRLDYDFGELLKDLSRFPAGCHAHQVAHFTHSEMKGGNLVGVVSAGKSLTVLKGKIPEDEYGKLQTNYVATGDIAANAYYFDMKQDPRRRGYALISNANSSVARTAGFSSARTFLAAVYSHELNHFRNRIVLERVGTPAAPGAFVNPGLAAGTHGDWSRNGFINEIAARHEAWHVTKDIAGVKGPHRPPAGAFWNFAESFATDYGAYQDAGYMQGLSPAERQKQACEWLLACSQVMLYHYDDSVNNAIQAYLKNESVLAANNKYLPIAGVTADGYA